MWIDCVSVRIKGVTEAISCRKIGSATILLFSAQPEKYDIIKK